MIPSRIDICGPPVDATVGSIRPESGERWSWTCDLCEKVGDSATAVAALAEILTHLRSCEAAA